MSNEILALSPMLSEERGLGQVLALSTKQAYLVNENTFRHLWETSAPSYAGQSRDDHNKMIAFGEFTGSVGTQYSVQIVSGTTYQWSNDNGVGWNGPFNLRSGAIQLEKGVLVQFALNDGLHIAGSRWDFYIDYCWFMDDGRFNKFQVVNWNHGMWFLNRLNKLKFVQANQVLNVYQSCTDGVPSGVYVAEFYNHIFVGRPTYQGAEHVDWVMGCHLNDPSKWTPEKINEASYYEFDISNNTGEQPLGVTGMLQLREWLLVYTPLNIWYIEYIGLEAKGLVYQRKPLIQGLGSAFTYGVVGNDLYHFFWSDENCYLIDGTHQRTMLAMPKTIGDDVKDFFFQDIHPDTEYRDRTWGFIERYFNEVHWVYVSSKSTGAFDKELVYNFKEGSWSVKTPDANICSHTECCLPQTLRTINDLTTEIEDITTMCGQLQAPSGFVKRVLYGASDYKILRDETLNDSASTLLPFAQTPFLESQDEIYDSLNEQKFVDGLIIHGSYDPNTCDGVRLLVSGRFSVSDPINWLIAGVWKTNTEYGLFSFPRIAGRVFRYRFVPITSRGQSSVRQVTINAWAEYVFGVKKDVEK